MVSNFGLWLIKARRTPAPMQIWLAFIGERATLVAMAGASQPVNDRQSTFDWTGPVSANGSSRSYRYPKTFYPGVDGPVMPTSRLLKNSPPAAGQDSERPPDPPASPALLERRPKLRDCAERILRGRQIPHVNVEDPS